MVDQLNLTTVAWLGRRQDTEMSRLLYAEWWMGEFLMLVGNVVGVFEKIAEEIER